MRKYITSTILIITGLYLVFITFNNKNNPTYSETAFAEEALKFDKAFDIFISEVRETFFTIKSNFNYTLKTKDSLQTREYFLDQLKRKNATNSIGFFQEDYKIVARNENSSYVFAVDSTAELSIVKWQRFEGNKLISSWYESFEQSVYNTPWYKDLMTQNNKIKWNLGSRSKLDNPVDDLEFFYAGYSYLVDSLETAIVIEFSKNQLFKELEITSKKIYPRLSFMNLAGKELHINTQKLHHPGDSLNKTILVDSLQVNIKKHFSNFKDVSTGTFNFNYKNQIYWTSFKQLSEDSGIQYYLYTIPNHQLTQNAAGFLGGYEAWIGLILIILGGLILLIKKRFFYRPNRISIPSVEEILKKEENRYLEFKSSLRWDYRQQKVNPELEKVIMKTIAAFGNTDGGILLIGVDDDKNLLGLEKDFQSLKKSDADYYEVHLRNIMHKLMGVKYVSKYIRTEFESLQDDKVICKIKVISANEPLYLKYPNKNGHLEEKFYVRSGNSSHEIKSIAEINDYINSKFN